MTPTRYAQVRELVAACRRRLDPDRIRSLVTASEELLEEVDRLARYQPQQAPLWRGVADRTTGECPAGVWTPLGPCCCGGKVHRAEEVRACSV